MSVNRNKALGLSIVLALIAVAPLFTAELADSIVQEIALDLGQYASLSGINADNPLNVDNWQGRPEWEIQTEGQLDWYIGVADHLRFDFGGDMSWTGLAGSRWEDDRSLREDPEFHLSEARISLDLGESGGRLIAGKTMRKHGAAVLLPVADLLYRDTKEMERVNYGKWMAGFVFVRGPASAEVWCAPTATWIEDAYRPAIESGNDEPMLMANLALSIDIHRVGLLYYRNGADSVSAYYSGQIGDSLIPRAELVVSNHSLLRSSVSDLYLDRGDSPAVDAMCGISCAPSAINATVYLEYRYRSSGYDSGDWKVLSGTLSNPPLPNSEAAARARVAVTKSLPYLDTSIHTIGARIQNAGQIAGFLDCSVNAFWLPGDGFYVSGEMEMIMIDRMKMIVGASALYSQDDSGELAWWNEAWQIRIGARWTAKTQE